MGRNRLLQLKVHAFIAHIISICISPKKVAGIFVSIVGRNRLLHLAVHAAEAHIKNMNINRESWKDREY